MKKFLDGMFWDSGEEFELPNIGDPIKASRLFLSNLTAFTWNSLSTLEDNPATLPQTATILAGQSVGGLSIDDLMQVKHFSGADRNRFWDIWAAGRLHKVTVLSVLAALSPS